MSNSSLICYTRISPNSTNPRNHKIDTITIHCMAGDLSVETCGNVFAPKSRKASSNYGIGSDGRIAMYVEECNRSWCSSNAKNDNRAITIEVANDGGAETGWHVSDKAMESLIALCVDICRRNDIKELKWQGDKSLIGQVDKQNMTVHRWFAAKACPGDYLYSKHSYIASEVNKRLNVVETPTKNEVNGINHTSYSNQEFIDFVANVAIKDYKNHPILPSITIAQAIKESGWGKSELAQKANALFGIKKNGWTGQTYRKVATEQLPDGTYVTTQDKVEWRKYNSWRDSIIDHGEYLCTRKVGNQKEPNWKNLIGETNLDKALDYLQGAQYKYATSLTYKESLKSDYILKYGLTKYDDIVIQNPPTTTPNAPETTQTTNTIPNTPFTIKVLVNDLNYRSEPQMGNNIKGTTKKGIFTIVEVENGWGKLKSGVGWVYLENPNYVTIIDEPKEYVVFGGDTLIKIGQKTGVDWKTIAKINGIKSPWRIYIGQVLKLE